VITSCYECKQPIRDCSVPAEGTYVTGWYHIATGYPECAEGGTMARPAPLVNVRCPTHRNHPDQSCMLCVTGAEAALYFHNLGRCIRRLCLWKHS
jgi:hypothetical protein